MRRRSATSRELRSSVTSVALAMLLFFEPAVAEAQEGARQEDAVQEAAGAPTPSPSATISGFGDVAWGASEAEILEAFGEPAERRRLEGGLYMLAFRDELVGQPSLILVALLHDAGLVKAQEVIDVGGGQTCIELIRTIHRRIDLQYPLIRPAEQARNNTRDAICEAAPKGLAYWHRQWRDDATGSVVTVSLASGSRQIDVVYESQRFRDWAGPEAASDVGVLEDEGAPTEVLQPVP